MIIDLKNLKPTVVSRDLKGKYVLLYGAPKVGKTTFATMFPKNLLLAFEPGFNALNNQMVQPVSKWTEFKQIIRQLDDNDVKEMFSTITIDTCDIAWTLCEKFICQQNPLSDGSIPKTLGDLPYGRGYDLCKKEYDECFRQIAMMGYGMVFISHEQAKTLKNEKGQEYQKFMPTLPDRPRLIVNRMVDIIGYIRNIQVDEDKFKRFMFMRDCPIYEAGSRFKYMPDKIELSYENLVNAVHNAIDKEVAENGGTVTNEFKPVYERESSRPYSEAIAEARQLWEKIAISDENLALLNAKIETIFGRRIKLSETSPNQLDLLELMINEMKNM